MNKLENRGHSTLAKNIKLNIKNTQIAEAVNLSGLKSKLAKKKAVEEEVTKSPEPSKTSSKDQKIETLKEEPPRIRARSKSAFSESYTPTEPQKEAAEMATSHSEQEEAQGTTETEIPSSPFLKGEEVRTKTSAELRKELFGEEALEKEAQPKKTEKMLFREPIEEKPIATTPLTPPQLKPAMEPQLKAKEREYPTHFTTATRPATREESPPTEKLGPTGRHMRDYLKPKTPPAATRTEPPKTQPTPVKESEESSKDKHKVKAKGKEFEEQVKLTPEEEAFKKGKTKFKEFRDIKPAKKEPSRQFDARDRQGLRISDEEQWRKKRPNKQRMQIQEETIRPSNLSVRTPISIKDLASEMKLKSSQLIGKLFLQGVIVTLNDLLEEETTIQLLGTEFGCAITIDKSEERRIRITDQTIREELQKTDPNKLVTRPPVVAFMGHVDHGKTSLIDAIRKSNRAAGEAGAITQHIGAFRCSTPVGDITVLDTPGHEAFSAMRARGADVTDIVVLVVAGDEGLRQQSIEAIQHAKAAKVTIVVAVNKSDKPNFNPDTVYRQLAENELLPEVWGGQTITVNCSAVTGAGIQQLLEMLALQAEILELNADPTMRARGTVLESEMHKGLGHVATVIVQNGTLRHGDAVVFAQHWGRIKTMKNEYGHELESAGPSTPIEITGLSGLPEAGQEFIVVKNEKEAREIAEARSEGVRQVNLLLQQKKKTTVENLFQQASESGKKILNIVLRADVQGSLEALKVALLKIESDKADINIIFTGVGEISESDVQLAAASKAVIIGFHTQIESHADQQVKELGIQVRLHDIIYHAIDDVKMLMAGLLDKLAIETEKGKALVKTTFKSSHAGVIAGCQVIEGSIVRNHNVRIKRGVEVVWKGTISSLKRIKEDVKEVQKGIECGIILNNFTDVRENDIIESYEITYIAQEL